MDSSATPYEAYLLRLWPVEQNGDVRWRASLREVGSGEQRGFENLDALCAYLERVTRARSDGVGSAPDNHADNSPDVEDA
jgi:hypothetical protein